MKVCIVTTAFPRWAGDGQGAFVWEAARSVAHQGVHVQVVAMHSPGLPPRTTMEGITVLRPRYFRPERWEILRREGGGLPITWQKYPLGRLQILPFFLAHTLATIRCARHCDLVHAHWTLSAACVIAGRPAHRRPILATLHGSDIFRVTKSPVGAWLTRQVLLRSDRVMAVSHALMEPAARLGVPPWKREVIPDGVDTSRFAPIQDGEREDVILFVGSLIERKGAKYLLAAIPEVFRSLPQYRLVLIGDGPQDHMLKALAEESGSSDRISFLGFQPQEEVRRWMQRARLLVLPSLEEGLGVVLLEALACGTPVVASRVDGIPEVITPEAGVLVPPANAAALGQAIRSVLESQLAWAEMSRLARERAVSLYDWDHIAAQWIALYRSMLGGEQRRQ
jgi:glycosyltransferase involved in cell wall biosynthesis